MKADGRDDESMRQYLWAQCPVRPTRTGALLPVLPRRCCHAGAPQLVTVETPELAAAGLVLRHDFVSRGEERELVALADEKLADEPYVEHHYDGVISGYRECGVPILDIHRAEAAAAVQRQREAAWSVTHGAKRRGIGMFPHVQVIDMPASGRINAHRDNMKMFGEFTAGLNLLSSAVMRFVPCPTADETVHLPAFDVVLRPRSLYVMHGKLRWQYTHAVLDADETDAVLAEMVQSGDEDDRYSSPVVGGRRQRRRGRRISIIARDLGSPGFFGGTYSAYGMVM